MPLLDIKMVALAVALFGLSLLASHWYKRRQALYNYG
jgi:hypothetical protein